MFSLFYPALKHDILYWSNRYKEIKLIANLSLHLISGKTKARKWQLREMTLSPSSPPLQHTDCWNIKLCHCHSHIISWFLLSTFLLSAIFLQEIFLHFSNFLSRLTSRENETNCHIVIAKIHLKHIACYLRSFQMFDIIYRSIASTRYFSTLWTHRT